MARDPLPPRAVRALTAGAALAAANCVPALAVPVPAIAATLAIPTHTRSRVGVALSFDDGPHPQGTPAVLETLRAAGVRATFFLVGEQVARAPALAAEIAAAGHVIGIHGDRHRNQLRLGPRALRCDLARALERIADATGVVSELHRPPYGIYSVAGLRAAHNAGLRPLLWTHWGHDWAARATPASIAAEATDRLAAGSVVLLHDADHYASAGSWRRTADALPWILESIDGAGLDHDVP